MKKCPFCAELIQDEAIKCRYCSEFLDGRKSEGRKSASPSVPSKPQERVKWFHSPAGLIFAICTMGPFALPLVWTHPRYSHQKKVILTIIVTILTILAIILIYYFVCKIIDFYKVIATF